MIRVETLSAVHIINTYKESYSDEQLEIASRYLALKVQQWLEDMKLTDPIQANIQFCQSVCCDGGMRSCAVSTTAFITYHTSE